MTIGSNRSIRDTLLSVRAWALCAAIAVACLALAACTVSTKTPEAATAPTRSVPLVAANDTTPANLPPVIFVMLDWMNGDWGNPNYRFSYVDSDGYRQEYKGHPEYGALGGWDEFEWSELNPGKGIYDWTKLDAYIKNAQHMTVTLADGSVIAKPVGFAVATWVMENTGDRLGINYTPGWVGSEMGTGVSSCIDPDGAAGPCLPFCVPRWSSTVWQYWFDQFVLALGARYDNNPEFYNLAFVLIATGADEETVERKSGDGCNYGGNSLAFDQWLLHIMSTYNLAFPNTPQFIQATLHSIAYCSEYAVTLPSKMTGVKVNGMELDVATAEYYANGKLVGGVTGYSELYHDVFPTGYEPKHGNGIAGSYTYYMESLATHPHMYDTQLRNVQDTYAVEQLTGFPVQNFVRTHLGKTVRTTPDVWILLRDTTQRDACWTGSDGTRFCITPHRGDYGYFLDRRESAPNSATVALKAESLAQLPALARAHPYAWQSCRRTDQANGSPYMSFDISDEYPYTGMVPKSAGGQVSWIITATVVNTGGDSFSLEYKDYYGNIVQRRVTKGAALGTIDQWVDYTWVVDDAFFDNGLPGACDFRISSNDDGNEFMHRVFVRAVGPPPPTPTPTRTRPPTSTPTITPVPSRTSTSTNTPTGTITPPTPTNTATAYRTPTRTAAPTQSATVTTTRLPTQTPTPGPSLTPTTAPTQFPGGRNTVTLQQGILEYAGTTDTYFSSWVPAGSYSNQGNLIVKNDTVYGGLLRFSLSSLPAGTTINSAILRLYPYNRGNVNPLTVEVYQLRRPWVDAEANWTNASLDNPWGSPGANDTVLDRYTEPVATANITAVNTWYEFDVSSSVRTWVSNPASNSGWLLRGNSAISVVYHFASAQHTSISLRPQLIIDYTAPGVPLTPTPVTPTAVPTATRTATHTATATSIATNTPGATPSSTATSTVTPGVPIPTDTATLTPSQTPTSPVTLTPSPSPVPGDTSAVIELEGRTSVLELLLRSIIDILRRAGRVN